MYAEQTIVELLGKDKDAYVHPQKEWVRAQKGKTLCPMCYHLRPDVYPAPIDIPLIQLHKGTSYDGVFRAGVSVIHQSLLGVLRPHLRDYVLGRVLWKDGSLLENYHSIYFRDFIRLRGDRTTRHYVCRECDFIGTTSDAPYALRRELDDLSMFNDRGGTFYLSARLARVFPWKKFPDLEPCLIPVRDEPLPDDPWPGVERALGKLRAAFAGDLKTAYDEIDAHIARLNLPNGPQTVRLVVRDIELTLNGWVRQGVILIDTMSAV